MGKDLDRLLPGSLDPCAAPTPGLSPARGSSTAFRSGRLTHFAKCPGGALLFCSDAEWVNAIREGSPEMTVGDMEGAPAGLGFQCL